MPGPLFTGARSTEFAVGDLEGRHLVRVVIDGVVNSPFTLGTLQLDRSPPLADGVSVTTLGEQARASWDQRDAFTRTDPEAPIAVEVNASPRGDGSGAWSAFGTQPAPGDGPKTVLADVIGRAEGRYLLRVLSRDVLGNAGAAAIGPLIVDRTGPTVSNVRVLQPGTSRDRAAEIGFSATDDGVGLAGAPPVRVALAGRPDSADLAVGQVPGSGRVTFVLPGPGSHLVTLRVRDRLGNRTETRAVRVRVLTPVEEADRFVPLRPPGPGAGRAGERLGPGARWARARVRAFHARRGLRLRAPLYVARSRVGWRTLLGTVDGRPYAGLTTARGEMLIGPAATRGLDALDRARRGARGASRADLDGMAMGLAVLLHESLHATGPRTVEDVRVTRSGRAFEEGFTEAATIDLLPDLVARLGLAPRLRAGLLAAIRRYRTGYPRQLSFARAMSARAARGRAGSPAARAFRVTVADRWGRDRWTRLARATRIGAPALRAAALRAWPRGLG